jgi:hypothetical protein
VTELPGTDRGLEERRGTPSGRPLVYRPLLFPRGFLFERAFLTGSEAASNRREPPLSRSARVPEGWIAHSLRSGNLFTSPDRSALVASVGTDGPELLLLGHVYDPWQGLSGATCLEGLASLIPVGRLPSPTDTPLWDALDRLSGRFVLFVLDETAPWAVQDASGLQPLYHHLDAAGTFWASSHSQLLAETCGLERDPRVDQLVQSPAYAVGVRHLPGLITPFEGMKMLTANRFLDLRSGEAYRFFPREPHGPVEDWNDLVRESAGVLSESVRLLASDLDVAVSLSMGTDSRTTLAATRAVARDITCFSYASNPAEANDARGASELCTRLGLSHEFYAVDVAGYEAARDQDFEALLNRNSAGIRRPKVAEVAKIHTLVEQFPKGRLELKTHVSEIGRAFYAKRLGRNIIPARLSPRDMSNLYKRNAFDRQLLRWTDEAFAHFRDQTGFGRVFFDYAEADMFYWEHRMPQWGALANQDHDIIHDMTTIFNNRRLLVNFLKPSLDDRISDRLHLAVIDHLWPELLQMPLDSKTSLKARLRKRAERWFFRLNG